MSSSTIRYRLIAPVCILSSLFCAAQESAKHEATYISFQVRKSIPTYPMSVNDTMTVTGFYIAAQATHGFIRRADGTVTSFDVPGSQATQPASINRRGEITGSYVNVDKADGFVRSRDGTITSFSVQGSDDTLPVACGVIWRNSFVDIWRSVNTQPCPMTKLSRAASTTSVERV